MQAGQEEDCRHEVIPIPVHVAHHPSCRCPNRANGRDRDEDTNRNQRRRPERPAHRDFTLFADEPDNERDAGQMIRAEDDAQHARLQGCCADPLGILAVLTESDRLLAHHIRRVEGVDIPEFRQRRCGRLPRRPVRRALQRPRSPPSSSAPPRCFLEKLYLKRGFSGDANPWTKQADALREQLTDIGNGEHPLSMAIPRGKPSASIITEKSKTHSSSGGLIV
jgi:hypothetical protein